MCSIITKGVNILDENKYIWATHCFVRYVNNMYLFEES